MQSQSLRVQNQKMLDIIKSHMAKIDQSMRTIASGQTLIVSSNVENGNNLENKTANACLVDSRFDTLETRMTSVDKRVDSLETKMTSVNESITRQQTRFDEIAQMVRKLCQQVQSIQY